MRVGAHAGGSSCERAWAGRRGRVVLCVGACERACGRVVADLPNLLMTCLVARMTCGQREKRE